MYGDATGILNAIADAEARDDGPRAKQLAAEDLLPLVYDDLRRLAAARLAVDGAGWTLDATGLVHEAWMRVAGDGPPDAETSRVWDSRQHFFGASALAMRRILIDRARAKQAKKRGGGAARGHLDSGILGFEERPEDLLDLDAALEALGQVHPEHAEIVRFRVFLGMTNAQVAGVLEISINTVDRRWQFARAWLADRIRA